MKTSRTIKGRIGGLLWWPLFLLPAFLALACIAFVNVAWLRVAAYVFGAAYLIFLFIWFVIIFKNYRQELMAFARHFYASQLEVVEKSPLPYALFDDDLYFTSGNKAFESIFHADEIEKLGDISNELEEIVRSGDFEGRSANIIYGENDYEVRFVLLDNEKAEPRYALGFFNTTELVAAKNTIDDMQPVSISIMIDNLEEHTSGTEEFRKSMYQTFIFRKIKRYFEKYNATFSITDKDRVFVSTDKKSLNGMLEDKFFIVENIKTANSGSKVMPTISMGIGLGGKDIQTNTELSKQALETCIMRGGDQVMIKTPDSQEFFGGKTDKAEKNSKIKSRVVASEIKNLFATKKSALIMGHNIPDADSLGAAAGMLSIAKRLGLSAHIVLENVPAMVKPLCERILKDEGEDTFISHEKAVELSTEDSVLVLVDVNKPSFSECPELIEKNEDIVLIDHHRVGAETVPSPVISYISSVASSASELITEIIEYIDEDMHISEAVAMALYSGIVIDTDNFVAKVGARTFDAASFLRRRGADTSVVRKIFRESMEEFKAKADTISTVEIFKDVFAFGKCHMEGNENAAIIGAKSANDLLDISGIKASFVFTKVGKITHISARSIDEINVQLIMERIGGGGHLSIAGAQLECDEDGAIERVKKTIADMIEEGVL